MMDPTSLERPLGKCTRCVILVLTVLGVLALAGCERWALDRQMEELYKKDGGVKVYETVTMSTSEFEMLSKYATTRTSEDFYFGPNYRYVERREFLVGPRANAQKGEGQLTRWYHAIYRRSDDRLLGESVRYNRSGGDGFTFGFQPSGKNCPESTNDLANSVFIKGN